MASVRDVRFGQWSAEIFVDRATGLHEEYFCFTSDQFNCDVLEAAFL